MPPVDGCGFTSNHVVFNHCGKWSYCYTLVIQYSAITPCPKGFCPFSAHKFANNYIYSYI